MNNWDLVDLTAPKIVGDFLLDKKRNILDKLVRSPFYGTAALPLWRLWPIRANDSRYAGFSGKLLKDKEDLIHKACGWMLRE